MSTEDPPKALVLGVILLRDHCLYCISIEAGVRELKCGVITSHFLFPGILDSLSEIQWVG